MCWFSPPVVAQTASTQRSALESTGRAATSAFLPLGTAISGIGTEIGKGLLGGVGDDVTARSNRSLIDIQYLQPHDLRFTNKANCGEYVDLIVATNQAAYATPSLRVKAVEGAIYKGYLAGCVAQKTPAEKVSPVLRAYYDSKRPLLLSTPKCTGYGARADQLLLGTGSAADIKLALANLFLTAREAQCMR